MRIEKSGENIFRIPKSGRMNVPVKVFASEKVLKKMQEDKSLEQACNVASLPGIVGESIVMPDAHQGYGFSIGGVAAFDLENGIISPGGIGFDINCGVRLLATNLTKEEVEPKKKELLDLLFKSCPVGVGADGVRLDREQLIQVMTLGAKWAVQNGHGTEEDLSNCESSGCLPDADPKAVPEKAFVRGKRQLGTVGSGNHFVEIQAVDKINLPDVAKRFGITNEGQVVIMIHCGSRGFGHQICSDYIREMEDSQPEIVKNLVDKNLMYAPLKSDIAQRYWGAMNAAANFAFANRQILGNNVRESIKKLFPDAEVKTVYDVCHNIAKKETHIIDAKPKEVLVHRKGATRAFPAGSTDIPVAYQEVGQPVLIPGSMGTASYVLVGSKGSKHALGSTAHGAGRLMSRTQAKKEFPADVIQTSLSRKGIMIKAATRKGISEEAPCAYKDVDEVVKVSDQADIAKMVARLVPLGVIKG